MGMKNQSEKNKYSIIPTIMWEALSKVLSFGANKYSPENYKNEPVEGYVDSMFRHFIAWRNGEYYDPESGLPHVYHMFANAGFISCLEEINKKKEKDYEDIKREFKKFQDSLQEMNEIWDFNNFELEEVIE